MPEARRVTELSLVGRLRPWTHMARKRVGQENTSTGFTGRRRETSWPWRRMAAGRAAGCHQGSSSSSSSSMNSSSSAS
jgi:hypothetical protein